MGNQYRSQTVTDLYYLQLLPGRYWRRHAYIQRKTTIPGGLRLTTHINMVLGRLAHYTFDAVLVSAFLAGVKRSTGLTYVSLLIQLSLHPPRELSAEHISLFLAVAH